MLMSLIGDTTHFRVLPPPFPTAPGFDPGGMDLRVQLNGNQ